jgi:hypothetical protein
MLLIRTALGPSLLDNGHDYYFVGEACTRMMIMIHKEKIK